MKNFLEFIECLGAIFVMSFVMVWMFKLIPLTYELRSNFILSQGSIFVRDSKGIEYINFKVTSVWTVCQKCHFDSVAWHKHRKENNF